MPRRPPPQRELPGFYYLDHFFELIDFVDQHYRGLLDEAECRFIDEFRSLTRPEQGLYARLTNRKGHVFLVPRLRYAEIGSAREVLDRLEDGGWVASPAAADMPDMLACITRDQLFRRCDVYGLPVAASARKSDLVERLLAEKRCHADLLRDYRSDVVVRRRREALRFIIYLYFGQIRETLARFTLRDLGLSRTQTITDEFVARFTDRAEAMEHYYFASRIAAHESKRSPTVTLADEISSWPQPEFPGAARLRDKLALRLGKALEAADDSQRALACYSVGETLGCIEREIRLLLQTGERDLAAERLADAMDSGVDDETRLFAEDLFARKFNKKRTAVVTDSLRAATKLSIDESMRGAPERAVAQHYKSMGWSAYRTENRLWRTLFGLVFWDLLFEAGDSLHSPFEFLPSVLADNAFQDQYGSVIAERLAKLAEPGCLSRQVLRTATTKFGIDNGVFRWSRRTLDAIHALLGAADSKAVLTILNHLCNDYRAARAGFPDLMLIRGDTVNFVEVKAEGDQLRRNQLLRLKWLEKAGFGAAVVAVEWIQDPNQIYVVVDVETTGGNGEQHRVTEIGAVKVQHGEVIDTFQTLLNPERNIPRRITQLTGITPAMVMDAPRFADIADQFWDFLEGSIFVAHNVNFDYGFISREFSRTDRTLRLPKLCTVAETRRYYPGLASYSLAALCERFTIELNSHHRALCDAQAAAELLNLINARRAAKNAIVTAVA